MTPSTRWRERAAQAFPEISEDSWPDFWDRIATFAAEVARPLEDCGDPLDPCRACIRCLKNEVKTQIRITTHRERERAVDIMGKHFANAHMGYTIQACAAAIRTDAPPETS